ncbi:YDG domain-containing protein [Chryseobacterium sp. MDT2-18]|uniref:YDG domain-containing protein n=1 Tax=Chryseobacterium sp. MDT2-18 TaxID=1259136 RepID=UPI0027805D29|nr:YDG domain-containing protein [Chryseobacterium sp. MDT2-18]MDQ0476855.1 hypothetical protein [Chryseobacterium sp. MDT2-18]
MKKKLLTIGFLALLKGTSHPLCHSFLKQLFVAFLLLSSIGVWGQGTLGTPVFSENFGTLADATALTTANTNFSFVRVGISTTVNSLTNKIVAKNPSSFTQSSGVISAKGASISTVDKTGLTSFNKGVFTFKVKTPSDLSTSGAALISAVGTGVSFGTANGFTGAQLSAAFQINGTDLQIRAAGVWTSVQTVAVSTNYTVTIVFNNTTGSLPYGNGETLPANKVHIWIDGIKKGEYTSATASLAAAAFRIYTTTAEFEVDDIGVYDTLPTSSGFKVTYNGNGNTTGSAPTDAANYASGATVTVLGNTGSLTKTGYTFGGWNTLADGTGTNYTAGFGTFSITANTSLYAKWNINKYNVSYSGNGNEGGFAPATQNGDYNTGINLASNSGGLTKLGFTFNGWNTNAAGTGTHFNANTTYTIPASDTPLYAEWVSNAPSLSYTGTLSALSTVYGTASGNTFISISGTNLTAAVTVNAPAGFEISTSSGSGFGTSLSLPVTAGTLAATTIYIRLAATTAVGTTYNGNVSATSNATTANAPIPNSTVTTKALTITGLIATSTKIYDGNTSVSVTGTPAYSGLVNSETFSVSGSVSWAYPDANVGTGKTLTRTGSYSAPSTNYTVTQPALSADVTAKPLTISSPSIASKVYDGSATTGAITAGALSGLVGSETLTVSATGTYADANAGTGKPATVVYTLGNGTNGGLKTNYSLANGTGTGDITKAPTVITPSTINVGPGAAYTLPGTAFTTNNPDGVITYSMTDNAAATLTGGNTINGIAVGTNALMVNQAAGTNYLAASKTVTVNVNTVVYNDGDYRTLTSGNWPGSTGAATWERYDGSTTTWIQNSTPLSSAVGNLYILHTIKSNGSFAPASGTKIIVENGGIFTDNHSSTLSLIRVKNGGTFEVGATGVTLVTTGVKLIESGGTLLINAALTNTSTFWKGSENFQEGSIVDFRNYSGTLLDNPSQISNNTDNYLFGNLKFSGTTAITLIGTNSASDFNLIENNMEVNSSTNNILLLSASSKNVLINGNIIVNAGTLRSMTSLSSITVNGNLEINGGTVDVGPTSNGAIVFSMKLKGDLKMLNASVLKTTDPDSELQFVGGGNSSPQFIDVANTCDVNTLKLNVTAGASTKILDQGLSLGKNSSVSISSGGTLDFGFNGATALNILKSSGATGTVFTAQPGSILKITSPDGITTNATLSVGNVQTDTRSFATGSDYYFIGNAAQSTGNALPTDVRNLIINNSSNTNEVTLNNASLNVNASLDVQKGIFNLNDKATTGTSSATLAIEGGAALKITGTKTFPLGFNTIAFKPTSIVEYGGATQSMAHTGVTGYTNLPPYQTLKVSGTGIKTTAGITTVKEKTYVSAGELLVAATVDSALPNVFVASEGLEVSTGANFRLANNANLMQNENAANAGSIITERNAHIKRLDYVYWSSPVADQNLKAFSPGTINTRFYTYNEWDDQFTSVFTGTNDPATVTRVFESAKGYAIRAFNTQPTPSVDWLGRFVGKPHNADMPAVSIAYSGAEHGYNLVGNPYPSNIDFDKLVDKDLNTSNGNTIYHLAYFWTNTNPNGAMQGSGYPKDGLINNYAIYNGTGGTPATGPATNATPENPSPTLSSPTPNGTIKIGQGFIVKAKKAGTLQFKNNVREPAVSYFFDKSNPVDRFWLNLTTPLQVQTTTLIGYKEAATDGFELDYDAPLIVVGSDALFSELNVRKLAIQGRKAPLDIADVVSLGTSHYEAGNYTLSLGGKEGIFANGQNIYLKDKQASTITNLSERAYSFSANAGITEGRFEIVYKNDLVLAAGSTKNDQLMVYRDGNDFIIQSTDKKINWVELYDLSGKLIHKVQSNNTKVVIGSSLISNGVYVLKIDRNGDFHTKKIIK